MNKKITEAYSYIKNKYDKPIDIAVVLGSGLGDLANKIENPTTIDYQEIPGFCHTTIPGHAGRLIIGQIGNKTVVAMQGRFHYYEGHDINTCTLPVRVFSKLGIRKIILTNACGGIRDDLNPGSIVCISDHISLFAPSPLRGANLDEFGPRFVDMSTTYTPEARELAHKCAKDINLDLKEGVYTFFHGPMYETPAEIKAIRTLGGDMVGMSTVPEAIVARHCGMTILGFSLVTNKAAGLSAGNINHDEVMETANNAGKKFITLVSGVIKEW